MTATAGAYPDGKSVREACRRGEFSSPTAGLALGYVQANLVVLPKEFAFDFLLFCLRNPKPCPILEVTEAGEWEAKNLAKGSDIRTDLPCYRVWEKGILIDEPKEIINYWRNDLVSFLIGCSFSFENALIESNIPVRHIEQGVNVPMYKTHIPCQKAGIFEGPLVVSMRPLKPSQIVQAIEICSHFDKAHGTPIHFGAPETIGISDINKPDFGDTVTIHEGELPVFWACGVTPQAALMQAKIPFAITHKPGHMFVGDLRDKDLEK